MDRSLSRWPIIREWWIDHRKEALLLSIVGLITVAIMFTVLGFFFPIPGPG
jgi:hypothetical protein